MRTILIIEDNKDFGELLSMVLKSEFTVLLADNKESIFEKCRDNDVDIILSDYHIDNHQADEILYNIEEKELITKDTVKYIMSGANNLSHESMKVEINDFIMKPFTMKEIKNLLSES